MVDFPVEGACPWAVRPWYVLTVKPQHEKAVAQQLRARAVEEYLPLYPAKRRWCDRVAIVHLPLFPRYVFCRFTFEDRLKALQIVSVTSIVSFGGSLARSPTKKSRRSGR